MTVPGNLSSPLLATAAEAAAAAVGPTRSLRFNSGDTAYLSRTPSSAGDRRTWTVSFWIKKVKNDSSANFYRIFGQAEATHIYFYQDNINFDISTTGSAIGRRWTNQVFRDNSAWFHCVCVCDTTASTASERMRMYINGSEVTSFSATTNPSQNVETSMNTTNVHTIGYRTAAQNSAGGALDAYLADFYFIDGSALDPTSFGAFDDNGVWQAAAYSGTFGTNGFHLLDFANESTVGHDSSGNENDFTANNISTTAGAGNDVLFDSPTNGSQSDTGAGGEVSGNYATLNPLQKSSGSTLSNGNLDISMTSAQGTTFATMAFPASGKWYFECTANNTQCDVGIAKADADLSQYVGKNSSGYGYYVDGNVYHNDASVGSGATYTTGDVIGVAFDADAGTVKWYKNNSLQVTVSSLSGVWFPAFGSGNAAGIFNFGSRPFAYSAPSNHKALCTTNLPTPTIADGSDYFDTALWTGNGSTQSITGLGFSPDFVWIKNRTETINNALYDIVRGAGKVVFSNKSEQEATVSDFTSFNSDGFSIAFASRQETNKNTIPYVGWAWDGGSSTVSNTDGSITSSVRANSTAGFSIVGYTGDGSTTTWGHGLSVAPTFIIFKRRNNANNWFVLADVGVHSGFTIFEGLNNTNAGGDYSSNASASNTIVTLPNTTDWNASGGTYIAYCFAPVAGYSAFGSYTGTGSATNSPFVYLGFRARFILFKNTTAGQNWRIMDTARNTFNVVDNILYPNLSNAEQSSAVGLDILSNGFKIKESGSELNDSGDEIIYAAFAENPFQANGGLAR